MMGRDADDRVSRQVVLPVSKVSRWPWWDAREDPANVYRTGGWSTQCDLVDRMNAKRPDVKDPSVTSLIRARKEVDWSDLVVSYLIKYGPSRFA